MPSVEQISPIECFFCRNRSTASALLRTKPLGSPALPAPRPRCLQARLRPLFDQIALELGQRGEDMKYQFPAGRGGVDLFLQALKPDARFLQLRHHINEMPQRTPKAIQPLHHDHVALARHFPGGKINGRFLYSLRNA